MCLTTLKRFIRSDRYSYKHFIFNVADSDTLALLRFISNAVPNSPSHNDNVEFSGDTTHNFVIRIVARRFIHQQTDFRGLKRLAAIEELCYVLSQNQVMGCIFANGGIDFKLITVSHEAKGCIKAFLRSPSRTDPPKVIADIMEAYAWGIRMAYGIEALADFYYKNLFPILRRTIDSFEDWCCQGCLPEEILDRSLSFRMKDFGRLTPPDVHRFKIDVGLISTDVLQEDFRPLAEALRKLGPIAFSTGGDIDYKFVGLVTLGYNVLQYLLCTEMDEMWPHYRVAASGGPKFFTRIKGLCLHDESLAYIARSSDLSDFFPPGVHLPRSIAQLVAASVGALFITNPDLAEDSLRIQLGMLAEIAHDLIAESSGPPLMPIVDEVEHTTDPTPTLKKRKTSEYGTTYVPAWSARRFPAEMSAYAGHGKRKYSEM